MASVDIDKAIEAAKAIVRQAKQERRLTDLSNRLVRRKVEEQLELEDGTLEDKKYRYLLNDVVKEVVNSAGPDAQGGVKKAVKPKSKSKSSEHDSEAKADPPSSSKKSDSSTVAKAETTKKHGEFEKPKSTQKPASKTEIEKPKKPTSKPKETIDDGNGGVSPSKMPESSAGASSSKKNKKRQVQVDEEVNDDSQYKKDAAEVAGSPPKKKRKSKSSDPAGTMKNAVPKKGKEKEVKAASPEQSPEAAPPVVSVAGDTVLAVDGNKSESEMSSLIDDEPVKKKRKSEEKKPKGTNKEKKPSKVKGTSNAKEESPEEEQLKKLKSLVFACGVRKVWSKELKDIEPISKQITHVRGILSDLGMKGRLSLEQARTIKERREFQQELDEVREFAAKHAGEGRPKRSTATTSKPAVSSDSESEESEEEVVGPRRAKNARQSIMAFLQDQSDSE